MAAFPSDPPFPPEAQRRPPVFPLPCASAWGDDAHGLWVEVAIAGVVQCFRWIEPGEFWMGSPPDEPERFDREGPRHGVRLTAGYWLADTAWNGPLLSTDADWGLYLKERSAQKFTAAA